jgi:hypothetical protein
MLGTPRCVSVHVMSLGSAVLGLVLVSVAAAAAPTRTQACSCVAGAINGSQPAAGERDVALDFAPLISGYYDPTSVVLERSDGTAVPFQLRLANEGHLCGRNAELLPSEPFEADTGYRLRASQGDEVSVIEFTTGQRFVEEVALDPPVASGVLFPRDPTFAQSSCGRDPQTCVRFEGSRPLEIVASVQGREVEWLLTQWHSPWHDEGFVLLDTQPGVIPDCVEVRIRDEAGRRSPPTVLCGDALTSIDDEPDGSVCKEVRQDGRAEAPFSAMAEAPSLGCSAVGGQAASGRGGVLVVLSALLLLVMRRQPPLP